jgi:HAMP domain-containing protein
MGAHRTGSIFSSASSAKPLFKDGGHDLSVADRVQTIGMGLLVGVFALVLAIMLYFARRLTSDVVRPVEMLQVATQQLRAGSLDHRLEPSTSTRSNEIEELADAVRRPRLDTDRLPSLRRSGFSSFRCCSLDTAVDVAWNRHAARSRSLCTDRCRPKRRCQPVRDQPFVLLCRNAVQNTQPASQPAGRGAGAAVL